MFEMCEGFGESGGGWERELDLPDLSELARATDCKRHIH